MKTLLKKATITAAASTLLLGLTVVGSASAEAAAITCDTKSSGKDGPFYHGESASYAYDNRFGKSHPVPALETNIPQGTATWSNWDGSNDLILVTSYESGHRSAIIIGIDAKTGKQVGQALLAYSHVGGIAVFEKQGWAFVSGKGDTIRKYSLAKLKNAIKKSLPIEQEGTAQTVYASSFLTSHGPTNTLWAGKFEDAKRGLMHSYTVGSDGKLSYRPGSWEVPTKTQGLIVTKDLFIYSTSHGRNNRSNIYVVRRGAGDKDLDTAKKHCFRAPSMSEGLTVYGSNVYLAFESGAHYYSKAADKPRNIISNLHKAPLSSLAELAPR
ncbi:hypothetical protein [Amycolatopsis sp. EV170708-02-1]|uniref:hypothetical protein n=1 Tax=Amycolatopsis sp. EV170708-02-1 TaxID=2919322 RepID=UPI001F0C3EF1|nr:hypothetical protein [Amycolatopsis sp. EV170708-02-1]UMP03451.1 hypothetical protein MJQ72_00755 [Amycolatopsis sp. EV170708-02-1]